MGGVGEPVNIAEVSQQKSTAGISDDTYAISIEHKESNGLQGTTDLYWRGSTFLKLHLAAQQPHQTENELI